MEIKTLLSIEETLNLGIDTIQKARFMGNRIFWDYFTFKEQEKTISLRYDELKAMFDIMFDYIVLADNTGKELQAIVSKALAERGKAA